jgi:hypothetical protein
VRLGVSLRSGDLVDDPRIGARWMVEQNTPMLGRLLAEWSDRPAGALFLLPLWNPVLVAEQVGTLAANRRRAEQLRALATLGFTDVIVRHLVDDQREVLASTERLADVRAAIADA